MESLNSTTPAPDFPERAAPKVWIAHCIHKGCSHGVMAPTEWQAMHLLGNHIIQAHVKPNWTRGQES